MASTSCEDEARVLVLAPTARDAQVSRALFAQASLPCAICQDLSTLGAELARGVGVVVMTEEALAPRCRDLVVGALSLQPTWSSLPIIVLAGGGSHQLLGAPLVQQLGNVLVLERPIRAQVLLGVVQMALRTRRRQYQTRLVAELGRLLGASLADNETLAAVSDLLVPRLADCCILSVPDAGTARVAAMGFAPEASAAEARLREMLGVAAQNGAQLAGRIVEIPALPEGGASIVELAETQLQIVGATASLHLPLEVQGRLLGVLSLGMLREGRSFLADERQVVEEVAGRLALALNQAWLYRAEQAARAEAEAAVQARDELMALISHDLNNPLTVVLGQAQLLQQQLARDAPKIERLLRGVTTIGRAARQMQAQIAELLDTARLRVGQAIEVRREPTDLVALAQTVVAAAQSGSERHRISLQTQHPSLVALVDPLRIERVLDNLLSNAIKYSPDGGAIAVSIEVEDVDAQAWVVLQVQDQGIGIPAGDLRRVFERFHRASNVTPAMQGTGLGLASVRQIVEQHGGRVTAESPTGGGARFTIRIPLGYALG